MATILPNRAEIVYNYGTQSSTATSNQTSTTLLDQYTMALTKTAVEDTVNPNDNAFYIIRAENNGSGPLYNITLTDDLGGATDYLSYVEGSAQFYINGDLTTGTATAEAGNVAFTISTALQPGDNLIVVYSAVVSSTATDIVTNMVTGSGASGSVTGETITATAQATINIVQYASVAIVKTADKDTVISGDSLTYTFTLVNSGNAAAEEIVLTDVLPAEFTVNAVSYTANGTTTLLIPSDYTITQPNTITIPSEGSQVVIGVPSADATGPGVATVVITGTIS